MVSSSSMTEPGQPCVMISGSASSCRDLTWMKWMSMPSILVLNCGSAFKRRSHARQSYRVRQHAQGADGEARRHAAMQELAARDRGRIGEIFSDGHCRRSFDRCGTARL